MSEPDFLPPLPQRVTPSAARAAFARVGCDVDAFAAFVQDRGGALVDENAAPEHCVVTFVRAVEAPDESVVVLVDTITHMLRDALEHFVLEREWFGDREFHVGAFLLPRGLRATTGLLVERNLDVSIGADRASWRAVYDRLLPLGRTGEVVRSGEAGSASVLVLPGALQSPFTAGEVTGFDLTRRGAGVVGAEVESPQQGELKPLSSVHQTVIESQVFGFPMVVWAAVPPGFFGEPSALAIISDGECWSSQYPIIDALERLHVSGRIAPTTALFFAPVDPRKRVDVLGMREELSGFVERELLPWAASVAPIPPDPARRLIAGSSLGGLAAADLVRRVPELVGCAVVQSGSFWWPGDDPDQQEGEQLRLWQRSADQLAGRVRVFQEVGSLEGHLLYSNREFRNIAQGHGVDIAYREYVGGHDKACWRVGLLDAICHFFPAGVTS